jgi:hypothetical protein
MEYGEEYVRYSKKVPKLIPKIYKVVFKKIRAPLSGTLNLFGNMDLILLISHLRHSCLFARSEDQIQLCRFL